jgi:uncharacterized protein YkwD
MGDSSHDLEGEMFFLIKEYRAERELSELNWNEILANEARIHSENIATNQVPFSHAGFDERKAHIKAIFSYSEITEFVGWVYDPYGVSSPAASMFDRWLESPERKKIVESPYDDIGIGVAKNATHYYFTAILIKKK